MSKSKYEGIICPGCKTYSMNEIENVGTMITVQCERNDCKRIRKFEEWGNGMFLVNTKK